MMFLCAVVNIGVSNYSGCTGRPRLVKEVVMDKLWALVFAGFLVLALYITVTEYVIVAPIFGAIIVALGG